MRSTLLIPGFESERSLDFKDPVRLRDREFALDLDPRDSESLLDINVDRDLARPFSLADSDILLDFGEVSRCTESNTLSSRV